MSSVSNTKCSVSNFVQWNYPLTIDVLRVDPAGIGPTARSP